MTVKEIVTQIWEDEKRTKLVSVVSWEITGVDMPRQKNIPATLKWPGCKRVYLSCSHQGADVFMAFSITMGAYFRLKWNRLVSPKSGALEKAS